MHWIAACAAAACLAATPTLACVPYQYVNAAAEARIKTNAGQWVPIWIETDRSLVRIEYLSSKSPTGRFVIAGDIDSNWAYRFAAGGTATTKPKRVSMQVLLDQAGLPSWAFGKVAWSDEPLTTHGGRACRMDRTSIDWPLRTLAGSRVCVHELRRPRFENGLPLAGYGPDGRLAFEITKLDIRPIPLSRFNPPRPKGARLVIAARAASTCSG